MFKFLVIKILKFYQICISPMFGPSCRFHPSCSNYAVEAIKLHGVFKGCFLALRRVLRCHPGNEGGYDPVPIPCCKKGQSPIDH